jgi:hypothetical protein
MSDDAVFKIMVPSCIDITYVMQTQGFSNILDTIIFALYLHRKGASGCQDLNKFVKSTISHTIKYAEYMNKHIIIHISSP